MTPPIRTASCEIRRARKADAGEIAKLFLISSDGLAAYIWSRLQVPGMSLHEVGAARYAREQTVFSYENCMMAERGGEIAGMIHCHKTTALPEEVPEAIPFLVSVR